MRGELGILIPIVGMLIPITAIIVDYKRRKLIAEERRAMIEKGMVPPPLQERSIMEGAFNSSERSNRPERFLAAGLMLLTIGLGLAASVAVLQTSLVEFPPQVRGALSFGLSVPAAILSFLGAGNLVYYSVLRRKAAEHGEPR